MFELPFLSLFILFVLASLVLLGFLQYELIKQAEFQQREDLRHVIPHFRLHRMMSYLGINFGDYIKSTPTEDMKKQVINCRDCPNLRECDEYLHAAKADRDRSFCPNFSSLIKRNKELVAQE